MDLSEEQIMELETFISANQPYTEDQRGGISNNDLNNGYKIYNELKLKTTSYYKKIWWKCIWLYWLWSL